jgi:hypothetical protein
MKNSIKYIILAAAVALSSIVGLAQSKPVQEYETCVAQLASRCPIEHKDGWTILSFKNNGDTTCVELAFPRVLTGFLPALTEDTRNARALWLKQMNVFGDDWRQFVRLMLAARRALVIHFTLGDQDPIAVMTFRPEDFK